MAGGLFGLGAGTPSRFPYPDRPQSAPGLGPSQGQVIRARFVIITTTAGGLFVYSGTPGPGNPPVLWATEASTDPFGNTLQFAGVGVLNGSLLAGITTQATVTVGTVGEVLHATLSAGSPGIVALESGTTGAGDVLADLVLQSKNANGVGPRAIFGNPAIVSAGGTPANPTTIDTDVWQAMALNAGFSAGVPAPQFKLMNDRTVMCRGIVTLSANQAASTVFATLGANYVAAHGTQFATRNTLSGYAAGNGSVANAGGASTLAIVVAGVTGNVVQLDGVRYSTDA